MRVEVDNARERDREELICSSVLTWRQHSTVSADQLNISMLNRTKQFTGDWLWVRLVYLSTPFSPQSHTGTADRLSCLLEERRVYACSLGPLALSFVRSLRACSLAGHHSTNNRLAVAILSLRRSPLSFSSGNQLRTLLRRFFSSRSFLDCLFASIICPKFKRKENARERRKCCTTE